MKLRRRQERKEREDAIIANYLEKEKRKEEAIKNGTPLEAPDSGEDEEPEEAPKEPVAKKDHWGVEGVDWEWEGESSEEENA